MAPEYASALCVPYPVNTSIRATLWFWCVSYLGAAFVTEGVCFSEATFVTVVRTPASRKDSL
jgi:hypothetical protein